MKWEEKKRQHAVHHLCGGPAERDWRDREKVVDGLRDTVDKQRRDLDGVRKEIIGKEMLCSALRVGRLFSLLKTFFLLIYLFIALGVMFWAFFLF